MSRFSWTVFAMASLLSLSACSEPDHGDLYTYLMLHPTALKSEMAVCQNEADPAKPTTPHCEVVMRAGDQMLAMIEKQQKSPEKFGQEILRAQMEAAKSATQVNQDKVRMMLLVVGQSSPE